MGSPSRCHSRSFKFSVHWFSEVQKQGAMVLALFPDEHPDQPAGSGQRAVSCASVIVGMTVFYIRDKSTEIRLVDSGMVIKAQQKAASVVDAVWLPRATRWHQHREHASARLM